MTISVPFNDLGLQVAALRGEIDAAIARVLDRGYFILGPEGRVFEQQLADYLGVPYARGVANGTEAIQIALMAYGVSAGDEVICPALTAAPTALAVLAAGAQPVFCDVDPDTYTLDAARLADCLSAHTRAVLPVHLYGLPADIQAIQAVADEHNIVVIEDAAQAHGASIQGRLVGGIAPTAAFSFYPTKNVGALGDGGAVVTRDPAIAERVSQLRDLGQTARYQHVRHGLNSRLDEMQAAILQVMLAHLDGHNTARRERAAWYREMLQDIPDLALPAEPGGARHVYHLYVVRHPRRDALRAHLHALGIGTDIHYPRPLHRQAVFAHCRTGQGGAPVADRLCGEILSLPMYPYLTREQVEQVADAIRHFG